MNKFSIILLGLILGLGGCVEKKIPATDLQRSEARVKFIKTGQASCKMLSMKYKGRIPVGQAYHRQSWVCLDSKGTLYRLRPSGLQLFPIIVDD